MSRNHIGHETGITRLTGIAEAIGAEKEVRVVEGITSAGVRVDGIEVEQAHKVAALPPRAVGMGLGAGEVEGRSG
jgi:hypothetical protein